MRITLSLFVMISLTSAAFGQKDTTQMLTSFIQKTLEQSEVVPSVSVAIVDNKNVLFQQTFGYADLNAKRPATNQSVYYIASCTKSFTGLLAHILDAEGVIDLGASILVYAPFKDFESKEVFEGVTIMDLISHQSGIDNPYLSFRLAYTGDYTDEEILSLIEQQTRNNEKGKAFEYTNFGYYLFDYLLRAELGKSWKDLLAEKVFEPLGMTNSTAYISKISNENMAMPHMGVISDEIGIAPLQKTDAVMHAAGGLVTTAEDASKFLKFLLDERSGLYPEDLIRASYEQQVEAEHEYVLVFNGTGYASGWRIGEFENEKIVYHFGGYTGYFAHYSFIPEKNIGMAIFVNSDMGMVTANLISKYAYNLYLGNKREVKSAEKILAKKVPKALKKERKAYQAHQQKMSEREWNLSLPKEQYAGVFHNEGYGKVKVSYQNGELIVTAGNLKTTATPFPSTDTMRVELVPGSGTIIGFEIEDNQVVSLYHQRETFAKVNSQ